MTRPAPAMRAAYVERLGDPEEIRIGELPRPEPGPGQVLVRVEAVAVNPVDTYVRSGLYATPLPGFPFVVGRDMVGAVAATGPGVAGLRDGERVWCASLGYDGRQGPTAEYAVADAARLNRLPADADAVGAVAALHPAMTAWLGLQVHAGGVGPGDTVVVQGAAGNVGTCVTEVAAALGAHVVAVARPADAEWCRAHGAAAIVDRDDGELAGAVRAAAPDGAAVWFDTSGHPAAEAAVDVLAERGHLVLIASGAERIALPQWPFYVRSLRVAGFVISTATLPELADAGRAVTALLARGALRPRIAHRLRLDDADEGHRLVERGVRGRVVLMV